ncbi:hypothetical protein BDZ89DRAFT_1040543 [Hymenopellis radicata]|nr:hypothetical protein BDZ89DRAFT_1040543 [Hymenopellis radicata]
MDSEPQPDNITDSPDIQRLRSIPLDKDPGLTWPHQMRYQEIKIRLGERKARLLFSKLKATDKADKGWRTKAICTKCRDPEFKPNFTFVCPVCPQADQMGGFQMVHINWVSADFIKQAVVKKNRNERFLKKTVSPEKQRAYIELATAKHEHLVDKRPELTASTSTNWNYSSPEEDPSNSEVMSVDEASEGDSNDADERKKWQELLASKRMDVSKYVERFYILYFQVREISDPSVVLVSLCLPFSAVFMSSPPPASGTGSSSASCLFISIEVPSDTILEPTNSERSIRVMPLMREDDVTAKVTPAVTKTFLIQKSLHGKGSTTDIYTVPSKMALRKALSAGLDGTGGLHICIPCRELVTTRFTVRQLVVATLGNVATQEKRPPCTSNSRRSGMRGKKISGELGNPNARLSDLQGKATFASNTSRADCLTQNLWRN